MIKLILPLILIVGIIAGVYLVQSNLNLFPKAQEEAFQERVTISNLAPTSLSVTYFTTAPTHDFIQYGENTDVPMPVYDSRMKDGLNPALYTHYFFIDNLKPDTSYYFKINSEGRSLPEGQYLTFKTAKEIKGSVEPVSFSGTMESEEGAVKEGIVFMSSEGQLLSAPVLDGSWGISFSGLRKADMNSYLQVTGTEQISFIGYAGEDGFGLLGVYSTKHDGIDIKTSNSEVPFYRINLGQQAREVKNLEDGSGGEDGAFWVRVSNFLKGAF